MILSVQILAFLHQYIDRKFIIIVCIMLVLCNLGIKPYIIIINGDGDGDGDDDDVLCT